MAKRRISGFEGEDDKMKTACKVFHVDLTEDDDIKIDQFLVHIPTVKREISVDHDDDADFSICQVLLITEVIKSSQFTVIQVLTSKEYFEYV